MKPTLLAPLAITINALPNANTDTTAISAAFDSTALACSYNTGCRSASKIKAAKYCGYCSEVLGTWTSDHVYQLNGQSGKDGCCDYGFSTSCKDSSKKKCGF